MSKPTGITLYTSWTANGWKISIALEELGLKYQMEVMDITKNETKAAAFVKINPNGRLPAIVDHDNGDLAVWESGSILIYLADKYGKGKVIPTDDKGRADVISWLMWQMAGMGPMQGQAQWFSHWSPVKLPATVQRFVAETRRLYGVLDEQLSKHEYVAGATYSIADIAIFTWALYPLYAGVDIHAYPHVDKWATMIRARPQVLKGMVPEWVNTPPLLARMFQSHTDPAMHEQVLAEVHAIQALTE